MQRRFLLFSGGKTAHNPYQFKQDNTGELEKELEEAGVKVEKGNYLPYAFTISNLNYLGKIAAFRQGKFAVQDESSQLAVAIADINEGDFVLDV